MTDDYSRLVAPDQLEIVRMLPANCERVWEYLVNPELRSLWFCAGETGDKPGEPFMMDFDHSRISESSPPEGMDCGEPMVMPGTIVDFEPPNKLSYRWLGPPGEEDTLVSIELTQVGENTRLHLVHSKLSGTEMKRGTSAGWHTHLDLLTDVIHGRTVRDFWVHFGELKPYYDSHIPVTSEG